MAKDNSYLNASTSSPELNHFNTTVEIGLQASILCLIIATSLAGNAMIMVAFYRFKSLQTITNVFILNLSVTDFLLALVAMPFTMVSSVSRSWIFGSIMCNIQAVFNSLFCTASITTLTFVSIERYIAICCPLTYNIMVTPFAVKCMLCYIWLHSIVCALSTFLFSRYSYLDFEFICTVDWSYSVPYTICFALIFLGIPFTIITVCYWFILKSAVKQKKRINCVHVREVVSVEKHAATATPKNSFRNQRLSWLKNKANSFANHKQNQQKLQTKRERKATVIIAIVVGTFMFCWFPHAIGVFCLLDPACNWGNGFYVITTWLAMLNSALNSAIYGLMNQGFRRAFKCIVRCNRFNLNVN